MFLELHRGFVDFRGVFMVLLSMLLLIFVGSNELNEVNEVASLALKRCRKGVSRPFIEQTQPFRGWRGPRRTC